MSDVVLSVEKLSAYYGNLCAIRDVSCDVGRGEAVCVIGPNGAGKTFYFQRQWRAAWIGIGLQNAWMTRHTKAISRMVVSFNCFGNSAELEHYAFCDDSEFSAFQYRSWRNRTECHAVTGEWPSITWMSEPGVLTVREWCSCQA